MSNEPVIQFIDSSSAPAGRLLLFTPAINSCAVNNNDLSRRGAVVVYQL